MKPFLQALELQLNARSKREKILFLITLILGIYFGFFHSFFLDSLTQIQQLRQNIKQSQIYLQSNKTQNIATELFNVQQLHSKLNALIQAFNSQSLPIFATLQKINDYALTHQIALWEVDSENEEEDYKISLVGNAPLESSLPFLDFVENLPLIHLLSFEILKNGDFKLIIQNHKILSALPAHSPLAPESVLRQIRQSLQKEKLSFFAQSPSKTINTQASIELEALFNQKAKINGNWLKKGESIAGYTLRSIQDNQVILKSKDATLKLQLKNKQVFQ